MNPWKSFYDSLRCPGPMWSTHHFCHWSSERERDGVSRQICMYSILAGGDHRKAIWPPLNRWLQLHCNIALVQQLTLPPPDKDSLCEQAPSCPMVGDAYILQIWLFMFSLAGCLFKSHILRVIYCMSHKRLSSLSVGSRHRREPRLTGLWRILFVL